MKNVELSLVKNLLKNPEHLGNLIEEYTRKYNPKKSTVEQDILIRYKLGVVGRILLKQDPGDVWLVGEGYAICRIIPDDYNTFTYWIYNVYNPAQYSGFPRWFMKQMEQRAKEWGCKYTLVTSRRKNNKAFCKALGSEWRIHSTILKKNL